MPANLDLDLVPIAKGGKFVHADFLIARAPVTAAEFASLAGEELAGLADPAGVKLATWVEALRHCNRLSAQAGRPPAFDEATGGLLNAAGQPARDVTEVRGFRLPTGAEWDYAARGGHPDPPYADWGAVLGRIYWDDPTSHFARPIAPKAPVTNACGLTGMLGYVREWCAHGRPGEDCRPRICGWGHYQTNYDCLIAYHVTAEVAADGAAYPFRLVLTA